MFNWLKTKLIDKNPGVAVEVTDSVTRKVRPARTVKAEGDAHVSSGRYVDAERCYRQVGETDPEFPGAIINLGFVLREQGRTDEARVVLERAVLIAAEDADSHYLLASTLEVSGPIDLEISHLQKAVDLRPDFEFARRQLITALFRSGLFAAATELCQQSLAIFPDSAVLHFYHSNLQLQTGDKISSLTSCKRALTLDPGLIAAQQSLSRLLLDAEQLEQVEASYRREIELTPLHFGPHHQLGVILKRLGKNAEAIELFKRAILLNPNSSATYSSLGAAYTDLDDSSEECLALAHSNFERAIAIEPDNSELHYSLGFSYWRRAELDRALTSFDRAIELNPNNAKARWSRVMLWAPAFSARVTESSPDRSGFGGELTKFKDWWVESTSNDLFVGELQPFFLTYQEENNRELLEQYGQLCAQGMRRWLDREKSPAFERPIGKRIRLGIVSADIRMHSVWMALIKGWLQSFDIERFEFVVFSLTDRPDAETAWARAKSDVFIGGPKTLSQWVTTMREQHCEILLYPAIGLHPLALKLASLRLAPAQINTWGHPDTSGLPTLDYYVSAEQFEPVNAQDHYSERLVLLPHLGNRTQPMDVPDSDPGFAALNIDRDRPILVCPGTPFKYQSANDHIFAEIARRVPNAQFVFFQYSKEALARPLQDRITKEFESAGLRVGDHVRFIRWLNFPEFHCLLRSADVMLDTIGFSGYNTALQAIECGLPLVTREGRFLRGRLASGILRRMDLRELIVQNKTDYVDLAVKLVTDRQFQGHIRREIERRRSILFDDQSSMRSFQDFLESVARPSGGPSANVPFRH